MVFIKTFRHSARGWGYEVTKGYGSKTEKPIECAIRELKDETGLSSSNFTYVGLYYESPSTLQNGLHCFIANDCEKKDDMKLEDYETISGCVNSLDELPKLDYNDILTETLVYKYLFTKKKNKY